MVPGSSGSFKSDLHLVYIVGSGVSDLPLLGQFAGQSSRVTPQSLNYILVPSAVWTGPKFCGKVKSAFP